MTESGRRRVEPFNALACVRRCAVWLSALESASLPRPAPHTRALPDPCRIGFACQQVPGHRCRGSFPVSCKSPKRLVGAFLCGAAAPCLGQRNGPSTHPVGGFSRGESHVSVFGMAAWLHRRPALPFVRFLVLPDLGNRMLGTSPGLAPACCRRVLNGSTPRPSSIRLVPRLLACLQWRAFTQAFTYPGP